MKKLILEKNIISRIVKSINLFYAMLGLKSDSSRLGSDSLNFPSYSSRENAPFLPSPCHHTGHTGHAADDRDQGDPEEGELGGQQHLLPPPGLGCQQHLFPPPLVFLCLCFRLCCNASPISHPWC